jgi:hypothetical protein
MVQKHVGMTQNERLYYNLLDLRYAIHDVFDTFGIRQRRFLELGGETWVTRTN